MRDLHLTHLRAVLIVDDKDVEPVLAMLHHLAGDNQDVLLHAELQSRRYRQPWPERIVLVVELRLEPNCPRGEIDLIVADRQAPGRKLVALRVHDRHFGRAGGQLLIDARHIFLRLGEDHGDRLQLRDRDDPGLLPGVDEIALVDEAESRAARDRGADGRIVELRPRGVDCRRVGGDRRGELQHHGVLRVELLLGGEVLLGERGEASEIELRIGEIGLVLRFLGDGLLERGLKRSGVDLGQEIALLDHLAFVKADLHDLAVDTGAHENGVVRLDLSDALKNDREIRALDRRHGDDNRGGASRLTRLTLAGRRRGLSGRAPNPVVQLVGEPAGGRQPTVRCLWRVDAIGSGSAARQYGDPREPGESHGRKPFINRVSCASEPPSRTGHAAARAAPDSQPSEARFRGKSANIILLVSAGYHQPNLTGARRSASGGPDAL